MCRVSRCCCCFSLRTGVHISVGYTVSLSVIAIGALIWLLTSGLETIRQLTMKKMEEEYGTKYTESEIEIAVDSAIDLERVFSIISLVIYVVWALFAVLMPIGLLQNKRGFLMPWMVMTWIMTVLVALAIINTLRTISGNINPYIWINFTVYVLTLVGNGCSICGVSSYYKNNLNEDPEVGTSVGAPPPYGQFKFQSMA